MTFKASLISSLLFYSAFFSSQLLSYLLLSSPLLCFLLISSPLFSSPHLLSSPLLPSALFSSLLLCSPLFSSTPLCLLLILQRFTCEPVRLTSKRLSHSSRFVSPWLPLAVVDVEAVKAVRLCVCISRKDVLPNKRTTTAFCSVTSERRSAPRTHTSSVAVF